MANILVVDDALFMRSALKYICELAGHKVVGMAADGGEAIKLYKELKPDLTLMEEMDGIEALAAIRKDDPNARVVMVTGLGQETKQEAAKRLGAVGYIRKPFTADEIKRVVERVIKG